MKKIGCTLLKIVRGVGLFLAIILNTAATLLGFSVVWMFETWSNLTMDELMYHLTAPLEGTNDGMIREYLNFCVVPAVLILLLIVVLFVGLRKKQKLYCALLGVGVIVPVIVSYTSANYAWKELDVGDYVEGQSTYSAFIDDNYADPKKVSITFPEQKRNLIYIFLESMETTYADEKNGGGFKENVIPELTQIAQDNEDFSGDETVLNGGYAMPGATWTMGAMFAHTSGIPLSVSIGGNSMDTQETFFQSADTLGDVLQKAGYTQTLMVGSDATFGGRKLYFTEHGKYNIFDYNYAHDAGLIPEDYRVWWGYEDERLFGFAKEKILELAKAEEPFNFTMLTVDTHFEDGYVCELCGNEYKDNQYANVMACSSRQVEEFISWIQQQEFYENTTVVLVGDHPTMDKNFCEDMVKDYTRKVYTAYINSAAEVQTTDKRNYTTFDNFPTTIASLGAEIEGERLGLGTNLFSSTPTLTERFGINKVQLEMNKKSKLMEKLADINEDSEELMIREGRLPVANIYAEEYDWRLGYFPVYADNFVNVDMQDVQSVFVEVWFNEDKSDVQWIPLEERGDGAFIGYVNLRNFNYQTGNYQIHLYMTDSDENAKILGQTEIYVE